MINFPARIASIRTSRARLLPLTLGPFALALGSIPAYSQQILEIHSDSLVSYLPTSTTSVQGVRPLAMQRGVGIDGSSRAPTMLMASLAGNPFERVWSGSERHGEVRIDTGAYAPHEVDIALPAVGFSWVIGRSFNAMQESGGSPIDSNGYQGKNWFQNSQAEIVLYDDADNAKDAVYLVYGADRYVECVRVNSSSSQFKGKNGAAGGFSLSVGGASVADLYTYTDSLGNEFTFFGFDADAGAAAGQLWKVVDPAGNTAYVGHATNSATAISTGYDGSGRILYAYDPSDRRFTYTYTAIDSITRLSEVKAQSKTSGTWASPSGVSDVAKVNYSYYASGDTDIANGTAGDLKLVTLTEYLDDSGVTLTKKQYYRYWKGSYNAVTNPGYPHTIAYVVGHEGVRAFDWAGDSSFDEDFLSASESSLKPYAGAYFEYDSSRKVRKAWFNGECGCSGSADGSFDYTYASVSYSGTSSYDAAAAARTLIERPDGSFETRYFDETGMGLSRVTSDIDPASSSPTPKTWVSGVIRNSSGCVISRHWPDNLDSYVHSSGAISFKASAGLVRHFTRVSSGNMTGFLADELHSKGTGGTQYYEKGTSWSSATKTITDLTVVRPYVSSQRHYHTAGTSSGSNYDETTASWSFYSSPTPLTVETITTTAPSVSSGNNGSGSATSRSVHLTKAGDVDFEKDEGGVITYHAYSHGKETTTIQDADTTSLSPPSGFASSGSPLNLSTTSVFTAAGHLQQVTPPANVNRSYRSRLADQRLVVLEYNDYETDPKFYGPVRYTVYNQAGKVVVNAQVSLSGNQTTSATTAHIDESDADPISAADLGTISALTTYQYSEDGHSLESQRAYFALPSSGAGTDGTHYDQTSFGYDSSGRKIRTKDATGTIRRSSMDVLGRVISQSIGTNDNGEVGGESTGTNNMVTTEILEYDGSASSQNANSHLTQRTVRVTGSSTGERVTTMSYDLRGRLLLESPPAGPYVFHKYDNRGRKVASGLYSSSASLDLANDDPTSEATNRVGLTQSFYDERGQLWKTQRHKIDPSDGSDDDSLVTQYWRDAEGREIKVDGEELKKTSYDRLGRAIDEYVLAEDDDAAYTDVDDVSGDIVLEEHQTRYDATSGVVLFEAHVARHHNDISTGETTGKLDTNADLDPLTLTASDLKGRVQISAYWYDRVERQVDRVEYGTYGGATWTRPSTAPARSDTALRSTNAYGTDGRLESVTNALGLVHKYEYDALGRRTKEIQNYVDGVPSGAADDVTVITSYTDGLRTALTADLPSPEADQVTTYSFGTSKGSGAGDSAIARNDLIGTVAYPDSSGSSDVVSFAYNAQGQETWKSDQSGNVYETEYDSAGRMVKKVVSTLASGFDGAVRRQEWSYDALGRLATAVQYDATTAGNATDGIKYSYDAWGNFERFEQDRNSAVAASGGDEYDVSYAWVKATNGRNTLRKTNMVLPGSRSISYTYRTSGGLHDEEASRVSTVVDDTGSGVTIAQYDYLGTGTLVRTRLNAIACFSRVYDGTNAIVDLDRFNRITTNRWTKDLATDRDLYQTVLTYDRASNITSIEDNVHTGFDAKYTLDGLQRLTQTEEGTLSSGSITSKTRDQQWTLSHTGNWDRAKLDLNGDGDFSDTSEHDDTRSHNAVNELTARDTDSNSTNNFTFLYDAAGNLSDDGEHYEYEYDAFYRLRKVKNTSTQVLVAEYRYNALNHRIGVHEDSDTDGDVDSNDPWYYDAFDERWRLLARYRGSDTAPKEDFVPHQAGDSGHGTSSYIDLVICRNRDADTAWTAASDGTLEERSYLLQNWRADVSAVVSGSGLLKEWVKYSSYGVPIGLPGGDTDSDGDCDANDITQVQTWITASAYDVRGDVDLDGDVDASDKSELQTNYQGITLGRGVLSSNGIASRKGYAGYEGLTNLAGSLWLARNRVLMAELGRWGRRDPLDNVDGPNLYAALTGNPPLYADFSGMSVSPNLGPACMLREFPLPSEEQCGYYLDVTGNQTSNDCLGCEWVLYVKIMFRGASGQSMTVQNGTALYNYWHPPGGQLSIHWSAGTCPPGDSECVIPKLTPCGQTEVYNVQMRTMLPVPCPATQPGLNLPPGPFAGVGGGMGVAARRVSVTKTVFFKCSQCTNY